MINFEKFTNYSQEIIFASNAKKDFYKNTEVQPEHIILAMIEDNGIAKDYLQELKLLNQHFINEIVAKIKSFPTISGPTSSQQVFLSRETNSLFEIAFQEAENLKDEFVGIECILLAMTKLENSFIKELLRTQGVNSNTILNVMKKIRGNKKVDNKNAEENLKALQKYSTDLTERARKGKLDPVIGRDEEVRRIIQVLNRRTKNNPVLIGEPGVGKTAIAEGLALKIASGDVPAKISDKEILKLPRDAFSKITLSKVRKDNHFVMNDSTVNYAIGAAKEGKNSTVKDFLKDFKEGRNVVSNLQTWWFLGGIENVEKYQNNTYNSDINIALIQNKKNENA